MMKKLGQDSRKDPQGAGPLGKSLLKEVRKSERLFQARVASQPFP